MRINLRQIDSETHAAVREAVKRINADKNNTNHGSGRMVTHGRASMLH